MSKMQQDFVSPPERGQDLAILTYGKEALAAVVRDRLIPNGIKKTPPTHRSAGACPPRYLTAVLPLREPFFFRASSL